MTPKYEALRAAAEKAKRQSFGCVTVLTDDVISLLDDLRRAEERIKELEQFLRDHGQPQAVTASTTVCICSSYKPGSLTAGIYCPAHGQVM